MRFSEGTRLVLLWMFIGVVAMLVCSLMYPAAHLGDEYLPVGNDSFYHARRIIDVSINPGAFYELDPRIHAPEGSLLTWPWGYDYAMGWLLRFANAAGYSGPPMGFLMWVPVVAVLAPVALIMLIARRLSLSIWSAALAGLCVAFSTLTLALHGVGSIDHHFVEYIFVLATIAAGLIWFAAPDDARRAALLGAVLGVAPAIHNGMFILQLPVLAMLLLRWLQGHHPPRRAVLWFSGALLLATVVVLIPSLPFRTWRFEYYTLSWFHLYVAAGSVTVAAVLGMVTNTRRNLVLLVAGVVVFLLPLTHQFLMAHSFLTGTLRRLDVIGEMRSVPQMTQRPGGFYNVSGLYSLLIWLWPFTLGLCAYRAWTERESARLFFWIYALCGLVLLGLQFRLHYFGSFALFLPWLVVVDELSSRRPERRKLVMLATSLVLLLSFALGMRFALPSQQVPAGDADFPALRPMLEVLRDVCAREPGVVLTDQNVGHYIRYYTECSVISNNFLLTKQHAEKVELSDRLFSLSAEAMPAAAPYVRYVLVRPDGVESTRDGGYLPYTRKPLVKDLLMKPEEQVSRQYALLREVGIRPDASGHVVPLIRLYMLARPSYALN